MSNNKERWMSIGNFLLGVEKTTQGRRVVARSSFGDWRLMWSEGTMMYTVMMNFMRDEKTHEYLRALLTLQYAATNYPHDMVALIEKGETPFINGFTDLMNKQTDFEVSVKEKPTPEEDEAALKEAGEIEEVKEELEKLEKENGE